MPVQLSLSAQQTMKSQKEIDLELFKINLGYYLIKSPECDSRWAVAVIRSTSISPVDFRRVLYELEGFGDSRRYRKLYNACRNANFISTDVRSF